ncbi:ArnT family glycosyltransferase [Aedoeadaptatus urinae]|uniref:ArnT family glycosyltransferase n=1 Tax=Aedoeadaptatus urinae TaxID=1871017 RepID=UPI00097DA0B6|nr:hypothetical protein [Peptoniphilus urinae]
MQGAFQRRNDFFRNYWVMLIILWLLFFERLWMLSHLGSSYSLKSDDLSYFKAGITLFRTGTLIMHGVISAQIMPGLPAFIALFCGVFGTGSGLWLPLKLAWCIMGTMAAWFTYLAIREKAPAYAAIIVACFYFVPDFAWQDNLILTETPYLFLVSLYLYGVMRMGNRKDWTGFAIMAISTYLAFMLKAQAICLFLLPLPYLWIKKYPSTRLYLQAFMVFIALLAFMLPWSVRNYKQFRAYIPTTYGIGNPLLLGTYQGVGYPSDDEVSRQPFIDETYEEHAFLKDKDGKFAPKYKRYFELLTDEKLARARMVYWWKHDRDSMLKSYLWLKPKSMIGASFYWDEVIPHTKYAIIQLRTLGFYLAMAAAPVVLLARKYRAEVFFVLFAYLVQVYMYAYAFVFDRYAQTLLPFRFMAIGFLISAAAVIAERLMRYIRGKRAYREGLNKQRWE